MDGEREDPPPPLLKVFSCRRIFVRISHCSMCVTCGFNVLGLGAGSPHTSHWPHSSPPTSLSDAADLLHQHIFNTAPPSSAPSAPPAHTFKHCVVATMTQCARMTVSRPVPYFPSRLHHSFPATVQWLIVYFIP